MNRFGFSIVGAEECDNSKVPVESYHFHRLDVFNQYVDWEYKGELIESFRVPPSGCEILTSKIENATVVVSVLGAQGTIQGNNVIFGVRSKVNNPEMIVFSIKYFGGESKSFMWDENGIKEVVGMGVGVYTTSIHQTVHPVSGIASEHPWYYFNESWLDSRMDLEFDMDGCNYVSYVRPEAYFVVRNGVCYDSEGNDYDVQEVPCQVELEFDRRVIYCWFDENKWWYVTDSTFRKRPDSKYRINLMINSMVTVDKLKNNLIVPRGSKRVKIVNPTSVLATQRKTYSEKVLIINSGKVPLVRDRLSGTSRNACVWRFLVGRDDYLRERIEEHLKDLDEIFIGNNATLSKRPKTEMVFRFGEMGRYYLAAKPRFDFVWFLVYFRYVDYRDMFPDEFLVKGTTPYYRVFLAVED